MGAVYSRFRNMASTINSEEPQTATPWRFTDGEKIASLNSRFRVNMCFKNRTSRDIEAFWLNFEGKEVSYGIAKPGMTLLLYTYLSHPWVFRFKDDGAEALVVHGKTVAWPSHVQQFADVVEAPLLEWSPSTHATDFRKRAPGFAHDVQNLLRAYYAQRKHTGRLGSDGGSRSGGKSRRSSVGGMAEDPSPTGALSGCFGGKMWHWRGHEECLALPSALVNQGECMQETTSVATPRASSTEELGLLGSLPFDIILEIAAHMAPKLHVELPMHKDDAEIMPRDVRPGHGPIAFLAAKLLGPSPPPAPNVAPGAWFAAGMAHDAQGVGPLAVGAGIGAFFANGAVPAGGAQEQQAGQAVDEQAVSEVVKYMEAVALAELAVGHAEAMHREQLEQAPVLLARVQAEMAAALKAAADAAQPAAQAEAAQVEQQGAVAHDAQQGPDNGGVVDQVPGLEPIMEDTDDSEVVDDDEYGTGDEGDVA
ncbi:hypothetical protein Agub_g5935 [Astrephomene gubernaculifera]|uniref:von Hippel-Lindau disease tumour suppressor beta domain-containing protein n=1 Tax=Astrephomene gubernaculifera TaxID=47775 RepID=A0AAD3HL60_9CHLO|nr:hypothetical protein Agub_g5935 [Astrephomene gubernaculifera]